MNDRAFHGLRSFVMGIGPGDLIADRWEISGSIGEGAMGTVYEGTDRQTGQTVAIKMLHAQGDDARFLREVSALSRMTHPAIVRYIAHGVHAEQPYVVMDRLNGCTLAERLEQGPLSVDGAIALGKRLAAGLASVHAEGITHRDLKPSNVMLVERSVAMTTIVDFGLARPLDASRLTRTGDLVGTPGYMAPEQVRATHDVGPAADVFALGCVLWECIAGRPLFEAEDDEKLFAKILLDRPPPLDTVASDASKISGLIDRMLDKDPARRPAMEAVEKELPAVGGAGSIADVDEQRALAPGITEGTIIGKYKVESLLGIGGMGVVVGARHLDLGTRVALKLLQSEDGAARARFLREARAASRLESAHVARVLDVARNDDGIPYMVMEHLSGLDLADKLAKEGPLPLDRAMKYVLETCEAIAEAHALGIVHRDLKPSNLFAVTLRDGSEMVKVLDFGISKVIEQEDASRPLTQTDSKMILGSIPYMSPEQLHASSEVDARTDVWSLGVVLYELLSNTRPFEAPNATAIAARIAAHEPTPLREVVPSAPAALERVILRCLEKDPARRHPNLAAFARALGPFAPAEAQGSIERVARLLGVPADAAEAENAEAAAAIASKPAPHARAWIPLLALALAGGVAYGVVRAPTPEAAAPSAAPPSAMPPTPPATSVQPVRDPATSAPAPSGTPSTSAARASRPPRFVPPRPSATPPVAGSQSTRPPAPASSDLDLRDPSLQSR
jgi:serine/threonine-protein kinase